MATVNLTADLTRGATAIPDNRPWYVWAASYQGDDDGVITPVRSNPIRPVAGVLTIPVEPGIAAYVENPDGKRYLATMPVVDTPLWDVIEAAVAYPPETTQEQLAAAVAQSVIDNADALTIDDIQRDGTALSFRRGGEELSSVEIGDLTFDGDMDSITDATAVGKSVVRGTSATVVRKDVLGVDSFVSARANADAYIDFSAYSDGDPPSALPTGQTVDSVLQNVSNWKPQVSAGKLVHGTLPASGAYADYFQASVEGDCYAAGTRWTVTTGDGSTEGTMCLAIWDSVYEAGSTTVPKTPCHLTVSTTTGQVAFWISDGLGPGGSRLKALKIWNITPPASDGSTVWETAVYIDADNGIAYIWLPAADPVTGSRLVTVTDAEIATFYAAAFTGRSVTDGAITAASKNLTSATAAFTSSDLGKTVTVAGAGVAGGNLDAYIASVTNSTTAVLSVAASTTVSGATVTLTAIPAPTLASTLAGADVVMVEHFATTAGNTARYPRFLDMWGKVLRRPRERFAALERAATTPAVAKSAHYAPTTLQAKTISTSAAALYTDTGNTVTASVVAAAGPLGRIDFLVPQLCIEFGGNMGRTVTDAAISGSSSRTTLTSATATFTQNDVGRSVVIFGAGASGTHLHTWIASVTNGTTAIVADLASTTVSGAELRIGPVETMIFGRMQAPSPTTNTTPNPDLVVRGKAGERWSGPAAFRVEGLTPNAERTWTLQFYRYTMADANAANSSSAIVKFGGASTTLFPTLKLIANPR